MGRDPRRRRAGLSRTLLAAAVVAALAAPLARADGDPASDVLPGSDVYFPYSPKAGRHLRQELTTLLQRSRRHGYVLKIALIQTAADLGAYPAMMGHPRTYMRQLAAELSYLKRLHLLVIMPSGFAGFGLAKGWRAQLRHVRIDAAKHSNGLVRAAIAAVPRLARQAGHPLG